jgi:starvation-inducible DNA-binding protein
VRFDTLSPLGDEQLTPVVASLRRCVYDLSALHAALYVAHRNVKGPGAESFHKFFGEVAAVVFEHVDTLDERITQLGGASDATVESVAARTTLPKYDATIVDGLKHCRALYEAFRAANVTLDDARNVADDNGDQNTFDDLVQASKALEKYGTRIGNHLVSG